MIDVRSRTVVRQVPDEALLRMRAYSRALAQGKGMNAALNVANLRNLISLAAAAASRADFVRTAYIAVNTFMVSG